MFTVEGLELPTGVFSAEYVDCGVKGVMREVVAYDINIDAMRYRYDAIVNGKKHTYFYPERNQDYSLPAEKRPILSLGYRNSAVEYFLIFYRSEKSVGIEQINDLPGAERLQGTGFDKMWIDELEFEGGQPIERGPWPFPKSPRPGFSTEWAEFCAKTLINLGVAKNLGFGCIAPGTLGTWNPVLPLQLDEAAFMSGEGTGLAVSATTRTEQPEDRKPETIESESERVMRITRSMAK